MRALIIDPFKRVVREAFANFEDYRVIRQFVGAGELGPVQAPFSSGPRLHREIHSYVDDEGCYRPDQAWSRIDGYDCPLAGYVLILGDHGPEETDVPPWLTTEDVAAAVDWIEPEEAQATFPPITVGRIDLSTGKVTPISSTPVDFTDIRPLGGRP
jgi:hypothetical protein